MGKLKKKKKDYAILPALADCKTCHSAGLMALRCKTFLAGKTPTVRKAHVMKQETKKCRKQLPRLSLIGHVPSETRSVKMGVTPLISRLT